ncbi:MAG: MFS transporter [Desertimonas sp.]
MSVVAVFTSSSTIVASSLPTLADDLESTESMLGWSVTGLFLTAAVGTPVLGRLGDVVGHRRLFLAGTTVLSGGTFLCALAPNALWFVAARMVVGVGLAAAQPMATSLILAAYPVAQRARAMGWFQMVITGAPVLGLAIGGPVIDAFGWRPVFVVLAGWSVAALIGAWRGLPTQAMFEPRTSIDWRGAAALAMAIIGLLVAVQRGAAHGPTDAAAIGALGGAIVASVLFVRAERAAPEPIVDLVYLRRPDFGGALVAQWTAQFAYTGAFLITPLVLDDLFGLSITAVALVLLTRPFAVFASAPVGGWLPGRIGESTTIALGAVTLAGAMGLAIVAVLRDDLVIVVVSLVLSGAAMGMSNPSITTAVAGAVAAPDLGIAAGMQNTASNVAALTGIQVMFATLGDGRSSEDFARVFAVAMVAALLGVVGAWSVRGGRRRA